VLSQQPNDFVTAFSPQRLAGVAIACVPQKWRSLISTSAFFVALGIWSDHGLHKMRL
jgi:hypothetical protein